MFQDLILILQQVLVTVSSAVALLIAVAASRYLTRLMLRLARKAGRARRYTIDVGTVRIEVAVAISSKPAGRESLPGADEQ